jgi:hypothetical protein
MFVVAFTSFFALAEMLVALARCFGFCYRPTDNGDQPFFAEVNARARQIAAAAENAAGTKKKYNPPTMVNAR